MFRRDFITREIEIFIRSLSQIIFKKENSKLEEAQEGIRNTSTELIGLDIDFLKTLPIESIMYLLNVNGTLDPGKCYILAELLRQEAEINEAQGKDGIRDLYDKSLFLYRTLGKELDNKGEIAVSEEFETGVRTSVKELEEKLKEKEL